ncbi:AQUAPORIN-LIKE [Salix koriyanagi]|uniref:AQUAPORIN-LIKE n=1 Tax=Salix koriyanagi TaxID=2511006 RepID=A0A9Q0Z0I2_9ROSI|nr:AQUAPORIN-LIKE [Salix koriyanagi]
MAGIAGVVHDEESGYGGNRVQPFASTPRPSKTERGKRDSCALSRILGLDELVSLNVWRASLAEVFGTATLVFAMDTIVISSYETQTKTPNLIMATLIALTVAILLLATFPISGGHINPVITLSAMFTGLITVSRAAIYILAQCIGGILGALALKAVVNSTIEQTFSLGGCTLNIVAPGPNGPVVVGLETGQGLWLEIIFGLLVFISTTVTATKGYAGVGMNPARCLGPALVRGGHLWKGHWVFWVGPVVASVAFSLYTKIIPREHLIGAESK